MSIVKQIEFSEYGDPSVLRYVNRDLPALAEDDVLVRHSAIGVNFIDTYHRTGLYPVSGLPSGIGLEGAGRIEEIGAAVENFNIGDRVAYGTGPIGAYAQAHIVKADRLALIPNGVSDEQAAGMMLKGLTAQYLIRQIYPVKSGETVLFHAAAGGVGLIATQWLASLGATVIGTVGSEEKAELARVHGCKHVVYYKTDNIAKRVREITNGAGVPVVFDSVGKNTFIPSLDSLAPRGLMITFGNASGPPPPFDPGLLAAKGSLMLTRPKLFDFVATPKAFHTAAAELFDVVSRRAVKIDVRQQYDLSDAATAHRDLEGRKTTGSIILRP